VGGSNSIHRTTAPEAEMNENEVIDGITEEEIAILRKLGLVAYLGESPNNYYLERKINCNTCGCVHTSIFYMMEDTNGKGFSSKLIDALPDGAEIRTVNENKVDWCSNCTEHLMSKPQSELVEMIKGYKTRGLYVKKR
jgi:hypothetical protein